jgi:hypothetical protein
MQFIVVGHRPLMFMHIAANSRLDRITRGLLYCLRITTQSSSSLTADAVGGYWCKCSAVPYWHGQVLH